MMEMESQMRTKVIDGIKYMISFSNYTTLEKYVFPGDDDGDGIPNHLDNDDDGDGIPDADESYF